jgi:hypothetical protein
MPGRRWLLSFGANNATIVARQHFFRSTVPSTPTDPSERRKIDLVYPPVYEALRPFFDRRTQWGNSGGGQEVLAYRTLKDHFPELGPQEIFVTIITARQLFCSNPNTD